MSVHTVTIKAVPDADDFEYEITCPEYGNCDLWYECVKACEDYEPTEEETDEGEYTAHGIHHSNIDGMWMTNTGSCALNSTDSGVDGLHDIATDRGPGTYKVDIDYWGDGLWDLTLIGDPA